MKLILSVSELEGISLGVSIAVILLLSISYIMLFSVWHFYYKKCIIKGLEDVNFKKELAKEYKKYIYFDKNSEELQKITQKKNQNYSDYQMLIQEKKDANFWLRTLFRVGISLIYIGIVIIFITGLQSRLNQGVTSYFGKSYLVIETGSMETIHPSNNDLKENQLFNQIKQYSLIGIEKVNEKDMKINDIYAFYNPDGQIIVHRLVAIYDDEGEITYQFKGDANAASAPYETDVTMDKIIGKYTGYQNFIAGVFILYIQSNIGMITLFFAICAMVCFDFFESKVTKFIDERKRYLLSTIFPLKYNVPPRKRIIKKYRLLMVDDDLYVYRKQIIRKVK